MAHNEEHLIARIRQKLQDDGIKLWIPPYFTNGKAVVEKIEVCTHMWHNFPCNLSVMFF